MLGWLKRLFTPKSDKTRSASTRTHSRTAVNDPGPSNHSSTQSIQSHVLPNSSDGFNESLAVGYLTNDALIGGIVGGNLIGGMIGDLLNDSEEQLNKPEEHHHHLDDAEVGSTSDFDAVGGSHSAHDFEASSSDGNSFDGGDIGSSE